MPAISVSSPGKTILFGEHAVVYGHPAIAVPLTSIHLKASFLGLPGQAAGTIRVRNANTGQDELLSDLAVDDPVRAALQYTADYVKVPRLSATEISISSTIPIASGLGSSAALASTLIRGFSRYLGFNLSDQQINDLSYEVEKIQHGTPSGIDNTVITYKQPIYYIKGQPVQFLKFRKAITIIVADTGIPSLTKETVAQVKADLDQQPKVVKPLLEQMGLIAKNAKKELCSGNIEEIGHLMTENQDLLKQLGVSCPELDKLVAAALSAGALGAKLCGSGKGGNIVAVVHPEDAEKIKSELLANGAVSALIARVE